MSRVRGIEPATWAELFDMARGRKFLGAFLKLTPKVLAKMKRHVEAFGWPAVTSASSRRLRFPFGRRSDVSTLVGSVVTAKQIKAEPDRELWDSVYWSSVHMGPSPWAWLSEPALLMDWFGDGTEARAVWDERVHAYRQPRQCWAPDGTVLTIEARP